MKKTMWMTGIALALSMAAVGTANAGTPRLNAREHNQVNRIQNGRASGELTRPETRRLAVGQAHLRLAEARAKSDGVVTARERVHLQHEANQQSRRIYRQKHDGQTRD
jgi:hypothetical protein